MEIFIEILAHVATGAVEGAMGPGVILAILLLPLFLLALVVYFGYIALISGNFLGCVIITVPIWGPILMGVISWSVEFLKERRFISVIVMLGIVMLLGKWCYMGTQNFLQKRYATNTDVQSIEQHYKRIGYQLDKNNTIHTDNVGINVSMLKNDLGVTRCYVLLTDSAIPGQGPTGDMVKAVNDTVNILFPEISDKDRKDLVSDWINKQIGNTYDTKSYFGWNIQYIRNPSGGITYYSAEFNSN